MGALDSLATGFSSLGDAINPEAGLARQQMKNNADQKSALLSLVQQAQQNQQPSPQQLDQNGQPMNAQAQAAIAPFLQRLATMNQGNMAVGAAGNNPAAFQQAQQAQMMTQSPFAAIQLQIPVQQQQADLANKKAATFKDSLAKDAAGNTIYTDADTGQQTAIGHTATFVNPDVQKLHELGQIQTLQNGGAYGTQSQQQGQNSPAGSVGGLINQAFMTDAQKADAAVQATKRQENIQEADKSVAAAKTARDSILPGIQEMENINNSGNLPSIMPEEQAAGSNLMSAVGAGNGAVANSVARWNSINSGNFTKALSGVFAGSPGMRMEKPIAEAVSKGAGIPLEVPQKGRADILQQFKVNAYNQVVNAQNNAARLRDPNAQPIPNLPANFTGKMHYMDEVNSTAQKYGQTPQQVMDFIKSKGGVIVQ